MDRLVVPPEVTLNGDWLEFRYDGGAERARRVRLSRKLLTDFLRLRNSTDYILRYARRWGPLGFCEHDLPCARCRQCRWPGETERHRESLATWLRMIHYANWIVDTGSRLQKRDLDIMEEEFVDLRPPRPVDLRKVGTITITRPLTLRWSHFLNVFFIQDMDDSHLRVTLSLAGRRPRVVIGFSSLFGALVLQLALAITQSRGLTTCSACGDPFFPQRNWKYCDRCGRKAAMRAASKQYYWKKKAKAQGHNKVSQVGKRRRTGPRADGARRPL